MKNSGDFSEKIAKDPLGAATLATFFGTSGQQIQMSEGVKYEAIIDESDSQDEREDNDQKVKKQKHFWVDFILSVQNNYKLNIVNFHQLNSCASPLSSNTELV
jgi:hypothetical protein